MVRAMLSTEKDFELFFGKNVVAVGWSEVDFTSFEDIGALLDKVNEVYYRDSRIAPQFSGKKLNEVRRFMEIKEGDYILVPYQSFIRLAIAESKRLYDKSISKTLDLSNQLQVEYQKLGGELRTIPRNGLFEGLQRRLRVRGSTVTNLSEFGDQIEEIFDRSNYSWQSKIEEEENKLRTEVKDKLLENIWEGKTNLETGGIGLEILVKELLECEGYDVWVLPKQTFKGAADADIRAIRPDKFQESKLLIQVKHHRGYTDEWGLKQLKYIKQLPDYQDYTLVLLTSAEIDEKLRKSCRSEEVLAIDGHELVDWIMESIDKLKPQTRRKLGMSNVPKLIF